MDTETKKIIEKQAEYLPEEIGKLFDDPEFLEKIINIGKKYNLTNEQSDIFQTETILVLLGLVHIDEYSENLNKNLKINQPEIDSIVLAINKEIFSDIKPQLEELYQKTDAGEQATPSTPGENKNTDGAGDELDERFTGLSDGIKQIIVQSGYYTKLYGIAEKNKLTVPQMGTLEEITTGVITDAIHPEEFEKRLIKNLGLPEGAVRGIANDINEQILRPIREKMEETYNKLETNAYEIKPARNASSMANAGGPQIDKSTTAPSGIKIVRPTSESKKPDINAMELKEGDPVVDQKMNPVMGQKLAETYKATTVKTDHSLGNLRSVTTPKKEIPKVYPPNADPYREIPE